MNDKLFNYFYDAMNFALEYLDDERQPDEKQQVRDKLDKAIGVFYDWYMSSWEHLNAGTKINPPEDPTDKQTEMLEEIQSICIGADSPDAIENGKRNPADELQKCREDISAISNITESLLASIKGE